MVRKHLYQLFLIKEGEVSTVLYFITFFLVIGFSMALANATANTLFLKRFGIDYLPLVYLVQGGACFIAMMLYASIADLISSERFFKILFALLAASVLGFWAMISMHSEPLIFPVYFLFSEIVADLLLVHTALYLNQNINTLQAKRLSPVIFAGLQIGTVLGGLFLAAYASTLGTDNILIVWFALLLLSLLMIALRHSFKGSSPYFRPARKSIHKFQRMATHIQQGVRFTKESELLRTATIAMIFMVITYYIISYSVKRVYTESFILEEDLTAFFGALSTLTSMLALVAQLFLTSRLIQRFGVPTINLLYPLTSLASLAGMIFQLGLPTAISSSINIKSVMPAFHNPVRTMFLNILPQQIQGRVRAMTMAIILPVSLITSGIMLWFLQKMDDPLYFLVPGAITAGLFLYFSILMNRAYGKTLLTHLREHLFLPEEQSAASLRFTGKENINSIVESVGRGDELSVSFAKLLVDAYPESAAEYILPAIRKATPDIADVLLKTLSTTHSPAVYDFLLENPQLHDNHYHATALGIIIDGHIDGAVPLLRKALDDADPRIQATAIHGVLCMSLTELLPRAETLWVELLNRSANAQLAALGIIPDIRHLAAPVTRKNIEGACQDATLSIFHTQNLAARTYILHAYSSWQGAINDDVQSLIIDALSDSDPGVRAAAVSCIHLIPQDLQHSKLKSALSDGHIKVRNTAVEVLRKETPDTTKLALKWISKDNIGTPRAQETLLNAIINNVPVTTLESIVDYKIKDARNIHRALISVQSHQDETDNKQNNHMRLLQHLLEERFQQILEIALTAMEPLCARNVISTIRAGIRTLDERHMANACEALHSIPHQTLTQPLGQLLQDAYMPSSHTVKSRTESIDDVLELLASRSDTWLNECADAARAVLKRGDNV